MVSRCAPMRWPGAAGSLLRPCDGSRFSASPRPPWPPRPPTRRRPRSSPPAPASLRSRTRHRTRSSSSGRRPRGRTPTGSGSTTTRTTRSRPRRSSTTRTPTPGPTGPTGAAWRRSSTAASTASAPRATTRSRTTRCSSRTARTRARWARCWAVARTRRSTAPSRRPRCTLAGDAAYVKDSKVPLRIDFADDVAGPFPANFLCFEVGVGPDNLCDKNAGKIYGYNAPCSVPGSAGKATDVHLHRRLRQRSPDGNLWACVIAADASIPDNPSGSNQSATADKANLSDPNCDGVVLDRTPPTVAIGAASTVGQGRRPRVAAGHGLGRHVGPRRRRPVDVGRQHRRRERRRRHAHLHAGRHLRGRADRHRRGGQRGDGEEDDHGDRGRRRRDDDPPGGGGGGDDQPPGDGGGGTTDPPAAAVARRPPARRRDDAPARRRRHDAPARRRRHV